MGTRVTVTSTISVPVCAAWKCSKCGKTNFETGEIRCSSQETASGWSLEKKVNNAERKTEETVRATWKSTALGIIKDPIKNYKDVQNCLYLSGKCDRCKHKEKWAKGRVYEIIQMIFSLPTLLTGIAAFRSGSIQGWIIFLLCCGVIAWSFYLEKHFKTVLENIPVANMPTIGALSVELQMYAKEQGYDLPGLNVAEIADKKQVRFEERTPAILPATLNRNHNTPSKTNPKNTTTVEASFFCRKCGSKLFGDSEFCHKCGTEVKK